MTKNRKYFPSLGTASPSPFGSADIKMASETDFGHLPDLERQSDILWTLEEQDQHDEAVAFAQGLPPSTPSSDPEASPQHARRLTSSNYHWERPRAEGEYGKRVTKHVQRRRAKLEPFEAVSSCTAHTSRTGHLGLTFFRSTRLICTPPSLRCTRAKMRKCRPRS